MSSEYQEIVLPDCTQEDLMEEWKSIVADAEYDYGHSGYSGTFAEKPELEIVNEVFESQDDAARFVQDRDDKWGPATAVRIPEGWYIGGNCSS